VTLADLINTRGKRRSYQYLQRITRARKPFLEVAPLTFAFDGIIVGVAITFLLLEGFLEVTAVGVAITLEGFFDGSAIGLWCP
jgi:hypothetical protein